MRITLDGPGKNALGTGLLTAVRDQIEAAGTDPILITGTGDAFSAGLDLREVGSLQPEDMGQFLRLLEDVVFRLFAHPAPTVAAVNGHAIAGGAVLARATDLAVATDNDRARIGLNEVALGLRFPPRIFAMMRHRLPVRHHHRVFLEAGLHPPAVAVQLGLVDRVASDPLAVAQAGLEALAAHPPQAYADTKADLQGSVGQPDPAGAQWFVDEVMPAWTSDALRQRIGSRLGKGG